MQRTPSDIGSSNPSLTKVQCQFQEYFTFTRIYCDILLSSLMNTLTILDYEIKK